MSDRMSLGHARALATGYGGTTVNETRKGERRVGLRPRGRPMTTTEITTPEVVAEEYRHFTRACGIPHDRTITLLAEAFHITEHSVRRYLRHHKTSTGALKWPNPTTAL